MDEIAKETTTDVAPEQPRVVEQPIGAVEPVALEESKFTGGMLANFFIGLLTALVSLITLGLAFPAMMCWSLRWKAKHTYLNGHQLIFDGTGTQLFGKYIQWAILSIITLGLYYIFSAKVKFTQWETKHTHFAYYRYDDKTNGSKFTGKWHQLFIVNFISIFVTVITLGLGYYWAHCYKERWYAHHKTIDGCDLEFNGTGMQYFGKRIVWSILTFITLGIYGFWLQIKSIKWTISHTNLLNLPAPQGFMSADEIAALPPQRAMSKEGKQGLAGIIIAVIGLLVLILPLSGAMHYVQLSVTLLVSFLAIFTCVKARKKCIREDRSGKNLCLAGNIIGAFVFALGLYNLVIQFIPMFRS